MMLTVSGWGAQNPDGTNTATNLMRVDLPLVHGSFCTHQTLVCAGGSNNQDSCQGDSGGPLTYQSNNDVWTLYGVVSHGPSPCGQNGDALAGKYRDVNI